MVIVGARNIPSSSDALPCLTVANCPGQSTPVCAEHWKVLCWHCGAWRVGVLERRPFCPHGPGGASSLEMLAAQLTVPRCLQRQDQGAGQRALGSFHRGRRAVGGEEGILALSVASHAFGSLTARLWLRGGRSRFQLWHPSVYTPRSRCLRSGLLVGDQQLLVSCEGLSGGVITEHVDSSRCPPCPCLKHHSTPLKCRVMIRPPVVTGLCTVYLREGCRGFPDWCARVSF